MSYELALVYDYTNFFNQFSFYYVTLIESLQVFVYLKGPAYFVLI